MRPRLLLRPLAAPLCGPFRSAEWQWSHSVYGVRSYETGGKPAKRIFHITEQP